MGDYSVIPEGRKQRAKVADDLIEGMKQAGEEKLCEMKGNSCHKPRNRGYGSCYSILNVRSTPCDGNIVRFLLHGPLPMAYHELLFPWNK